MEALRASMRQSRRTRMLCTRMLLAVGFVLSVWFVGWHMGGNP